MTLLKIINLSIKISDSIRPFNVGKISFSVEEGDFICIIGESGSGKSITAQTLLGLSKYPVEITGGEIQYSLKDIPLLSKKFDSTNEKNNKIFYKMLRNIRGSLLSMIFQDPSSSLDPYFTIRSHFRETLFRNKIVIPNGHGMFIKKAIIKYKKADKLAREMLTSLNFRSEDVDKILDSYPHELSEGMAQRVIIGLSLIVNPSILIADEPTTFLDTEIQKKIIERLKNHSNNSAVIYITHDLAIAKNYANKIIVMQSGTIVQQCTPEILFSNLSKDNHPYTNKLLNAAKMSLVRPPKKVGDEEEYLRIENITTIFGKGKFSFNKNKRNPALSEVSLSLKKGEILGIIGQSGSGKTTLAKTILGIIKKESGNIYYRDEKLETVLKDNFKEFHKKNRMIFQNLLAPLNPGMSIDQILTEYARFIDVDSPNQVILDKMKSLNFNERDKSSYPNELSGGQQRRVSLIKSFLDDPEMVIADEPFSGLDITIQKNLLELFLEQNRRKSTTLIIISHDMRVLTPICDRIIVMKSGKIIETLMPENWKNNSFQNDYTKQLFNSVLSL